MKKKAADKDKLQTVLEKTTERLILTAKTSDGGLKLFIDAKPVEEVSDSAFSAKELKELLLEKADEQFIDFRVLKDIAEKLNSGKSVEHRRVAVGEAPIKGREGKLVYLVKKYDKKNADVETVDLRFNRYFDNVEPDTIVARLYPPTPGTAGTDVLGRAISADPGESSEVQVDETIAIEAPQASQRYQILRAKKYGFLELVQNKLQINDQLAIKGDIDYRTGDIDFVGSVRVQGSVMKGFRVSARENIEVTKDVVGGLLESLHGSVTVGGQISGGSGQKVVLSGKASAGVLSGLGDGQSETTGVEAGGSVRALMVNGSEVRAGGDIEITKEVRGSRLITQAVFRMPKGHLLSGEVNAVCGVEIKKLGSDGGSSPRINLCSDVESSPEYGKLLKKLAAHESAEEMLKLYLGPFAENDGRLSRLPGEQKKKVETLRAKLAKVEQSKGELEEEREKLLSTAEYHAVLRVNFLQVLYHGVRICVGEQEFASEQDLKGPGTVEYLQEEEKFVTGELKSLDS